MISKFQAVQYNINYVPDQETWSCALVCRHSAQQICIKRPLSTRALTSERSQRAIGSSKKCEACRSFLQTCLARVGKVSVMTVEQR